MRKILVVFAILFGLTQNAFASWATVANNLPRTVPWVDNGVTYTHIALYNFTPGTTIVAFYCPDDKSLTVDYNYGALAIRVSSGSCRAFESSDDGATWGSPYYLTYARDNQTPTSNLSDFFKATRDLKATYTENWSGAWGFGWVTAGDILIQGTILPPSYLSFPLANLTAYTAPITSVMDRDTRDIGTMYQRNGTVTLFTGETGTAARGCHCYNTGLSCNARNYRSCHVPGYLKSDGTPWSFANTVNYPDLFVYYDGHPGYDYAVGLSTPILAPADGTLCVATRDTTKRRRLDMWRNSTMCPLAAVPGSNTINWKNYHAFYILHGSMYINGSNDEYMTVFLHNHQLTASILSQIYSDGYATVSRLNEVAAVGGWGPTGANHYAPHLHIEVYKRVDGEWSRVDPYGDGINGILWQR